jgi:hypothetical protein
MGVGRGAVSVAVVVGGVGAGAARTAGAAPARVDWSRGVVLADGLGVADRSAPSPAVALGTSRRGGEDRARAALATAVRDLALASGGKVADRLGDATVAARVQRAVDDALVVAAEPETDGSWHVTMAVPIEAVRQALAGPRVLPAGGDAGVAVVIVDGAADATPAVGWRVAGAAAPTLWVAELPAWAQGAPHVTGKRTGRGEIRVDKPGAVGAATVFVIKR